VRVDRDFFTITPQLEHFCEVKWGETGIANLSNLTAKYSIHSLNKYQLASLIDLAKQ